MATCDSRINGNHCATGPCSLALERAGAAFTRRPDCPPCGASLEPIPEHPIQQHGPLHRTHVAPHTLREDDNAAMTDSSATLDMDAPTFGMPFAYGGPRHDLVPGGRRLQREPERLELRQLPSE